MKPKSFIVQQLRVEEFFDGVLKALRVKSVQRDRHFRELSDDRQNLESRVNALNQETEHLRIEIENEKKNLRNRVIQDSQLQSQTLRNKIALVEKEKNHLKEETETCREKEKRYADLRQRHENTIPSYQALEDKNKKAQARIVKYKGVTLKKDDAAQQQASQTMLP